MWSLLRKYIFEKLNTESEFWLLDEYDEILEEFGNNSMEDML